MNPTVLRTASGVATAVGRREGNEDAFLAQHPLFLVADGMGGHDAGEVASALAVDAFRDLLGRDSVAVDELTARLERAADLVRSIPATPGHGAGTTLAGVAVAEQGGRPYWLVVNLGDSRVYRAAGGVLEQVSVDHSELQELLDEGRLAASDAAGYHRRHVVTRALGPQPQVEPDFWILPAAARDRLMVCSDGLTGELDDAQIAALLLGEADPQRAADRLVGAALLAGGHDNVTVVVVDAVDGPGDDDSTVPAGLLGAHDEPDDDTLPRAAARTWDEV